MSSVVGVWLVLRGMSFFGDAFVHGVLPGIAAAVIFGFNPYLGAAIAALVMVGGIELIHRQTALKEDTAIGLLFVGMMALGVVIISKSKSYTGSLTSILFGDIFGVNAETLTAMLVLGVPVLVGSLLLYRPLLALSFSPTKAQDAGHEPPVHPRRPVGSDRDRGDRQLPGGGHAAGVRPARRPAGHGRAGHAHDPADVRRLGRARGVHGVARTGAQLLLGHCWRGHHRAGRHRAVLRHARRDGRCSAREGGHDVEQRRTAGRGVRPRAGLRAPRRGQGVQLHDPAPAGDGDHRPQRVGQVDAPERDRGRNRAAGRHDQRVRAQARRPRQPGRRT